MIAAFTKIEQKLQGWPDGVLTILLLVAALGIVLIAFKASPLQKAVTLAYVVFP